MILGSALKMAVMSSIHPARVEPGRSAASRLGHWLGWTVLGLVGLVTACAVWLVWQFDAERVQALLTDWMRRTYQRELRLGQPLELAVFPRLQVRVRELRLSEHGQAQTDFVRVQDASFAVEVLPLLRQQLVVDRVQARGVVLKLTRDAQGRRNIDDLLDPPEADRPPQEHDASPPLRFEASGLDLQDLQVEVDDRPAALRGRLTLQHLKAGRLAAGHPAAVDLALEANLAEPKMHLSAQGGGRFAFDARDGWRAESLDLHVAGSLLQWPRLDLRLKLAEAQVAASLTQARLQRLQVELQGEQAAIPFRLVGNWDDLRGSRSASASAQPPARLSTQPRTATPLAASLAAWSIQATPTRIEYVWGDDDTARPGPTARGSLQAAALSGPLHDLHGPGLRIESTGRVGPQQFTSVLTGQARIRAGEAAFELTEMHWQASLSPASERRLDLDLVGRAAFQASGPVPQAKAALQGQLDGQKLTAEAQLRLPASGPDLTLQAHFDRLDLDRFLPAQAGPAAQPSGSAPATAPVAGNRLDFSALNTRARARIDLRAGHLNLRGLDLRDLRMQAGFTPGHMQVTQLQAQAFGGSLQASGAVTAAEPRLRLKASGQNLNVRALLQHFSGRDTLEGTGSVMLDLQSSGATPQALREHLSGEARLQLRDGAVRGFNLARALRQAQAALNLKSDSAQQAAHDEKTDFTALSASFVVRDGVARSDDLQASSPFLRASGAGELNLVRQSLDWRVQATLTGDATGQDGTDLAQLRGLTVPVHLSGPWAQPQWTLQWSAVARSAVAERARSRLEQQLKKKLGWAEAASTPASGAAQPAAPARAEEPLKKILRGLFK